MKRMKSTPRWLLSIMALIGVAFFGAGMIAASHHLDDPFGFVGLATGFIGEVTIFIWIWTEDTP